MMRSTPASASFAVGRSRLGVSEIKPILVSLAGTATGYLTSTSFDQTTSAEYQIKNTPDTKDDMREDKKPVLQTRCKLVTGSAGQEYEHERDHRSPIG